jgi:Ni/Co efflux regulator RcnB
MSHPVTHAPSAHTMHAVTHPHVTPRHVTTHHTYYHHLHATTRHAVSHHHHHAVAVHTRHPVHHVAHVKSHPTFHRAPATVVAKLRRNVVAVHRFHAGPYRAPAGWRYRRWVFGERLPAIYFVPGFWITDFLAFSLVPPPDGYVWVRYGPDALLIDQYTGEIVQVDYGVFY